jgi:hypothetical protein
MEVEQFDPKSPYTFCLTFGNNITDPKQQLQKIEFDMGVAKNFTHQTKTFSILILNVSIDRQIYQPGAIEVEMEVREINKSLDGTPCETLPSFQSVSGLFIRRMVTLDIHPISWDGNEMTVDRTKDYNVAKNYYVHEMNPQLKRDVVGMKMYVKLQIFSMDKLMTLNKYSKAYVACKLGSGILMPESRMFGYQGDSLIQTNVASMRFLKYQAPMTITDSTFDKSLTAYIPSEFIHPYLVQYNETFYDFMVRTSNRCGEFFYFEDGKLTLGLPDSGEPTEIDGFDSVTMANATPGPLDINDYARDSMKEGTGKDGKLNYSIVKKNEAGFPNEVFPGQVSYNSEVATDEYLFPLYKDKFTNAMREGMKDIPPMPIFNTLKTLMTGEDIVSSVTQNLVYEGTLTGLSLIQSKTYNDKMEKQFLTPYKNKSEQYTSDHAVLFGSLSEDGWTTLDYYNDVRKHEEEQQRQIVCIDMGVNVIPVKLGQKIKLKNVEGNYVIIQIQQSSGWTHDSNEPDSKRSLKILAIPSYQDSKDETEKFIPPVQPVPIIRKVGPQTAFITDNDDPKYQGRVRIAYPWQSLAEAQKKKLQDAQLALQQAENAEQGLSQQVEALKKQKHDLKKEIEDLKKYLEASGENRIKMTDRLRKEITELETQISDLKQQLAKQKAKIETNQSADEEAVSAKAVDEAVAKELEERIAVKETVLQSKRQTLDIWEFARSEDEDRHNEEGYSYEDNSVFKAKQDAYGDVCTKLKDARDKQKTAKQTLENSQKSLVNTKQEVQKTIAQTASPWIRVVTPMATPGGGTYFKPQIGDEVLVNYDNDNIERPYVVGSLFSKNTLDPAERYDRRGAPEVQFGPNKQVSMSITSPNGHHITFSDPDNGDKFIAGLNPGTQFLGSVLPTSVLKNERDLAGGIHIGDRYGIYEIEMQSHNRSISIKSPLGTVDINAFTGITISANNGDINIKGKNINIEAGNKLTLTSGKNIKKPSISDPDFQLGSPVWKHAKHWYSVVPNFFANLGRSVSFGALWLGQQVLSAAPAALNEKMGPAAFADLSLFRHMFEVAVKPVDGTLLAKSRRYLMLEAGKGEAKIEHDRHLSTSEEINSIEDFYKVVTDSILDLINEMDEFFISYESLYIDAKLAKEAYDKTIEGKIDSWCKPNMGHWAINSYDWKTTNYEWNDWKNRHRLYTALECRENYYEEKRRWIEDELRKSAEDPTYQIREWKAEFWDDYQKEVKDELESKGPANIKLDEALAAGVTIDYKSEYSNDPHVLCYKEFSRNATIYGKKLSRLYNFMTTKFLTSNQKDDSDESYDSSQVQNLAKSFDKARINMNQLLRDQWCRKYSNNPNIIGAERSFDDEMLFSTVRGGDWFINSKESQTCLKRQVVLDYLCYVKTSNLNREKKYIQFELTGLSKRKDIVFGEDSKEALYEEDWKNFIKQNFDNSKNSSKALTILMDGLVDPIKKKFSNPIGVVKENKIWDEQKGGRILFSDNDGATLSFKGEGLHSETGSNLGNRERLMQVLLSIN